MTALKSTDPSPEVLRFLDERRSNMAKAMDGPGPNALQMEQIIARAARVPDHRKLAPWRFLTFTGQAREEIGKHIGAAFAADNLGVPLDRILFESQRFLRAPCVIAVISAPKACPRGTPRWEQVLSAGALCFQMLLVARAMGFAAQWLTEWYAYDARVQAALGLSRGEEVAGFIYIGTATDQSIERERPDTAALTQAWGSKA